MALTSHLTNLQVNVTSTTQDPDKGPVSIGWLLTDNKASVLYDPPERLTSGGASSRHSKSAARCPAVHNFDARYFVINCPFDVHVRFERDSSGKPMLVNKAGERSAIRANKLAEKLLLVPEAEWRHKDRPMIQLMLPYLFVADETAYLSQLPAFAHYRKVQLPGTTFGGRFPIHVWPRPLMWAFEWHDMEQDLILKRGEPLFYCHFEGSSPERPIQMVEAKMTPELKNYVEQISGAVNYVNQTFSLFKAAERMRPRKLVEKKDD